MNVQRHEIIQIDPLKDEFTLFLYLDDHLSEFANEFGTSQKPKEDIKTIANNILKDRYPGLKVTMIKVILGGLAVTSISLSSNDDNKARAADNPTSPAPVVQTQSTIIHYQVSSGDTLWKISQKFNSSIDLIKKANNLSSDLLRLDQKLIIPKAIHIVGTGDYLTVLAKKYGTTVDAIKAANNLTSDMTFLGQTIIIPIIVDAPASPPTPTTEPIQSTNTYTVVAGDNLWLLAKRFGTTIDALRSTNELTSDMLQIGQKLTIPSSVAANQPSEPVPAPVPPPPVPTPEPEPTTAGTNYTVVSGDNLWAIANRFGTTITAIRSANNLTTDILQIGQVLTVPAANTVQPPPPASTPDPAPTPTETNTITYSTHTIASGDNIWNLSIRYGIPQTELLKANNLSTSSMLSIGQQLKIPVHTIAVKQVVSDKHGEYMDWWTEAQYVFTIDKTAKVTDFATGKSFYIKRTIGANHADSETLTTNDTDIAKSIWGGFSWTPRAVILEVDGRKLAASMSFMPHEQDYIAGNGITGHFDVYFGNSTRHVDGKADASHQAQVERAAGLR